MQSSRINLSSRARIECAPTFGRGYLAPDEDCLYSGLAHLIPMFIWPWMKSSSPAVNEHGKEAFNMAVTWLAVMVPLAVMGWLLPGLVGHVFLALLGLSMFTAFWMGLMGMAQARRGRIMRYRYNLRLIK